MLLLRVVLLVVLRRRLVHLDGSHLLVLLVLVLLLLVLLVLLVLLLLLVRQHVGNSGGMRCSSVVGHERQAEGVEGVDGE